MAQSVVKLVDDSSNAAVTGVDFFNEMRLAMSRQISTVTESAARQEVRKTVLFSHFVHYYVGICTHIVDHTSIVVSIACNRMFIAFTYACMHARWLPALSSCILLLV